MTTLNIRQTVVELCVELSHRGHFSGTGGNIALRIDATHIAVTPSATDYLTMTPADVCVLRLADLKQVEGERSPSVESGLHARVLRARPDVQASIHTHQPVASACALLGRALEVPPSPLQQLLGRRIPVVGYAPSGSGWLSSRLARALRPDTNAYLMFNHGVLCCGASTETALQAVEDLEALSKTLLLQAIAARCEREPFMQPALRRVADALAA
ncbi:class II aldolase/adducin family protein [Hydrogenophaga taeniospiralis CCUG 15921]|uniref:Class II aldolase/adducin family protein n=1 Tax=Hydrogenophaga taeniospiralis CCUG 15921 TaxID=1281780 RepID=A0A9X4NRY1_9BURK|nr:class II aldolase/adducin family protein [Hydrogenophaga taeniospiralis]MDG5975551.1 class II aldolase/adducin family protein [Hydrogenophaga taeniospiralis CCUG 15921]